MTQIQFLNDVRVELIDHMGSDARVIRAARVSVVGDNKEIEAGEKRGLINYLLKSRHGSVFEHCLMTFFVEAPIFVFREFMRHRIASYNEVSGRYTQLQPRFYVPRPDRKLVNVGTSARPEFAPGHAGQVVRVSNSIRRLAECAWYEYANMLEDGVANEVARTVLPVNIMSQMYVTLNLRSLMNFLSLRVDSPDSAVRSRPQYEIQLVAEAMELYFSNLFPLTHEAFVRAGRVAP